MLAFVDSYASAMITGSVMRPITDQFGVGREQPAYLLLSAAAYTSSERTGVSVPRVFSSDAD